MREFFIGVLLTLVVVMSMVRCGCLEEKSSPTKTNSTAKPATTVVQHGTSVTPKGQRYPLSDLENPYR